MIDSIKAVGTVTVQQIRDNKVIKVIEQPNLITTVGKGFIASRMKDGTATAMSHMAIGSSNTTPAVGDTTMTTSLARVALDSTTVSTNVVSYVATFPAGVGTGTVWEAGLFNDPSTGTMLAHTLFASSIDKQASDQIVVTWQVTIG